jgi:hypothetical protein
MTEPRKPRARKPKGKEWSCPECEVHGLEDTAEKAAFAWIRHWNAEHQEVPF